MKKILLILCLLCPALTVITGCQQQPLTELNLLSREYPLPDPLKEVLKDARVESFSDTLNYGKASARIQATILRKDSIAVITRVTIFKTETSGITVTGELEATPINMGTVSSPVAAVSGVIYFTKASALRTKSTGRPFTIDARGKIRKDQTASSAAEMNHPAAEQDFGVIVERIKASQEFTAANKNPGTETTDAAMRYILTGSGLMPYLDGLAKPDRYRLADYIRTLQKINKAYVLEPANHTSFQLLGHDLDQDYTLLIKGGAIGDEQFRKKFSQLHQMILAITIPVAPAGR